MNITLSPELEAFITEQLETGTYATRADVFQDALRLLQHRKTEHARKLEALRRDIAAGIEQADRGELMPLDAEEIKAEGRRRLAERNR